MRIRCHDSKRTSRSKCTIRRISEYTEVAGTGLLSITGETTVEMKAELDSYLDIQYANVIRIEP